MRPILRVSFFSVTTHVENINKTNNTKESKNNTRKEIILSYRQDFKHNVKSTCLVLGIQNKTL